MLMNRSRPLYGLSLIALLSLIIVIGVEMPRFYAIGPGLVGVVFMALYRPVFKKWPEISVPAFVIAAFIIGFGLLSALWSIDPEVSMKRSIGLAAILIPGAFLISLAQTLPAGVLRPHLRFIPYALIAAALLTGLELGLEGPLYRALRGTAEANIHDHIFNRGAVAAVLFFVPGLFILKETSNIKPLRILYPLSFVMMMLTVESQSAQMAFVLGLLTLWMFFYKSKWAWRILGALITVMIFAAPFIMPWMFDNFAIALNTMPFLGKGSGYAGGRLEIWDYVSRYALQNPWTGFGIESTRTITDFDSAKIFVKGTSILHPHNFALQLWMEFGVIGAALGSLLCGYLLWLMRTRLTPAQNRIVLPVFIAALSVSATGYGMWQSWWLGLLFMTVAVCIMAVKLQTSQTDKKL